MCSSKLDRFKIYSNFHIHERKRKINKNKTYSPYNLTMFLFARKITPNYYSSLSGLFPPLIPTSLGTNLHSSHIDDICNCELVIWAWLVMNFGFASTSPLRGGNPVCQVLKIQLYFIEFSICVPKERKEQKNFTI